MDEQQIPPGARVLGSRNVRIGTVDAVFADYLLVRTAGIIPIDLYVPRREVSVDAVAVRVDGSPAEAYERWHRPLKRAPHE
jgi:hypothetical protein